LILHVVIGIDKGKGAHISYLLSRDFLLEFKHHDVNDAHFRISEGVLCGAKDTELKRKLNEAEESDQTYAYECKERWLYKWLELMIRHRG
jgi:hypothetical protein